MLENQPGWADKNDDLDLIYLAGKMFSFAARYGRLLALFAILGMLAGYALYKMAPRQYESTLLLHSSTLTNTEQINIIENWNALLKAGEYPALAERLHCDPDMLKKVSKITAAEIQKLYMPNNPNAFVITVLIKDNAVLDSLSSGIVYGFENNDYIKAKLTSRRSNLSALINTVKIEINNLDSTKKSIEHSIGRNSRYPSSSFIVDISTINGQVINLNEKLLAYQDELKFCHAVEIYHKFDVFEQPVSPRFFKSLALGLLGGFAIGYVLSLYLYLHKRSAVHVRPAHGLQVS